MNCDFRLTCVLFDLDGTLVDTAPDLVACLNYALTHHGFSRVTEANVKPFISYGAAAMIKASVGDVATDAVQKIVLDTLLDRYERNIAKHSTLFSGIPEILCSIEERGLKWGVITNKRKRFTQPLMAALDLSRRAACIVSGDSTANSKPHPEPMLTGCKQAGVNPKQCVYIGDASHDISAGKSAGMKTLAALYGYLKPDDQPTTWGADAYIDHPKQIDSWIKTTLCH